MMAIDLEREGTVSAFADNLIDHDEDPFVDELSGIQGAVVGAVMLEPRFDPRFPKEKFSERGWGLNLVSFKKRVGNTIEPYAVKELTVPVVNRFYTGFYEYDSNFLFLSLEQAQAFLNIGDAVTSIAVKLDDYSRAAELKEEIHRVLIGIDEYYEEDLVVLTWEEEKSKLLQAVVIEKYVFIVVLFLVVIVAGFNVVAVLTMLVAEKIRDIGVLRSLGSTRAGISRIFLLEGVFIAGFGNLLGVPIGYLLASNLNAINAWSAVTFGVELFPPDVYYLEAVPVVVDWGSIAMISLATVVTCIGFSWFAARRAAGLKTLEAIRHE
jgi:lipoprotein-releasing system permease protein